MLVHNSRHTLITLYGHALSHAMHVTCGPLLAKTNKNTNTHKNRRTLMNGSSTMSIPYPELLSATAIEKPASERIPKFFALVALMDVFDGQAEPSINVYISHCVTGDHLSGTAGPGESERKTTEVEELTKGEPQECEWRYSADGVGVWRHGACWYMLCSCCVGQHAELLERPGPDPGPKLHITKSN
jgi:hypothetical protein